jgi:hypothetical protein
MREPTIDKDYTTRRRGWAVPMSLAVGFLLWGLLIFFSVGDRGQPPWGFGNIEDIPGQSLHSTHKVELQLGTSSSMPVQHPVEPQHVKDRPSVPEAMK